MKKTCLLNRLAASFAILIITLFILSCFSIKRVVKIQPASAQGKTILTTLCKDGYYDECSRAPKCGGKGYNEVLNLPIPDVKKCPRMCKGEPPLCCYEVEATGDPRMCVGYWERLWCHPNQCQSIPEDKRESSQCAHASSFWCQGADSLEPPIPLEVRLGLSPTQLTPIPSATPTSPPASPTSPPSSPTTGPSPTAGPSPTPPTGYFSNNFKIMGKVITGDLYQPQGYWQSGNYCGASYKIQETPSLNINGYEVGRLSSNLCNPEPYYLNNYYETHNAPGPITLTLQNLPAGYFCAGWTWLSDYDDQSGTGCLLTADFRLFPPYTGAGQESGYHHVSFYIKEGQPTATTAPGQPTPTRSPVTPSPVPSATITPKPVMGTVQFMMIKLGKISSKQSFLIFRDILISFFDWLSWLQQHM